MFMPNVGVSAKTRKRDVALADQMWVKKTSGDAFGDLIGSRLHLVTFAPDLDPSNLVDLYQPCLELLWLKAHFGYMPVRAGDRDVVLAVEELGQLVDASAKAGLKLEADETDWLVCHLSLPDILHMLMSRPDIWTHRIQSHVSTLVDKQLFSGNFDILMKTTRALHSIGKELVPSPMRSTFVKFKKGRLRASLVKNPSSYIILSLTNAVANAMGLRYDCDASTPDGKPYSRASLSVIAETQGCLTLDGVSYLVNLDVES